MIGKSVNQYKILEKIGSGGMGIVYKAKDMKLDRFVALKFLTPHLNQGEEEKKRFIHEAKAISALEHQNICSIFEINETDDGQMFIVMAYYNGESLKDRIKRGPLAINEAIDISTKIARGLAKAHSKGIIHRDIKPANILLTEDSEIKIVDFGLAKLAGKSMLTKEGTTLGTIAYMSPEQTRGTEIDSRTDIWALGVVIYEMLTGTLPFKGDYDQAVMYSILNEEPRPLAKLNPEVPPELQKIVGIALQKNPVSRYSSVNNILKDITEYQDSLSGKESTFNLRSFLRLIRKPYIAIPVAVVIILIILGIEWYLNRQSKIRWAREVALPKIEKLVDYSWRDYTDAYKLEEAALNYIPDNQKLIKLIAESSRDINIDTDPPGAKVYFKQYSQPSGEWKYLGTTPIKKISIPISVFRWKFIKDGYDTVFAAASSWNVKLKMGSPLVPNNLFRKLDKTGNVPPGMVRVPGIKTRFGKMDDFFIDKYEVTNKKYKEFIDKGGYKNKRYWKNEFIKDGKTLRWEEAMKLFVDQTGRPGPSTWQAGDYPYGQIDYPVSGISWYEASAYADFAGKELPTNTHWGLAMGEATPLIRMPQFGGYAIFASFSNFRGDGVLPVGKLQGISPYGAFDMAGNIREWCLNKTPKGRLLRGGAWNEPTYLFIQPSQEPPLNRSDKNGLRCVLYTHREKIPEQIFGITEFREDEYYSNQKPVSDYVFRIYKEQFSYDKADLNPTLESKDENSDYWIHETVSFNAAYNNERIIAHLFLPKNASPPYQAVIYFPGGSTRFLNSSKNIEELDEFRNFVSYIIKNGRAVLFPIYKGTFERRENGLGPELLQQGKLHQFSEYRVQLVKDFERCIDYLETRRDIDTSRIAYYGMSWGGLYGEIIPAIDNRLKVSVLISGGIVLRGLPEVSAINYITRVKIPTLMLNGKYDMLLPYNKAIKPMYDLLGIPKEDKKLILYETDHIPPKKEFMKMTLVWLDKYLGTVK
ncbi:MAG: protein kinase [Ignavibacteriaceae bacterium]